MSIAVPLPSGPGAHGGRHHPCGRRPALRQRPHDHVREGAVGGGGAGREHLRHLGDAVPGGVRRRPDRAPGRSHTPHGGRPRRVLPPLPRGLPRGILQPRDDRRPHAVRQGAHEVRDPLRDSSSARSPISHDAARACTGVSSAGSWRASSRTPPTGCSSSPSPRRRAAISTRPCSRRSARTSGAGSTSTAPWAATPSTGRTPSRSTRTTSGSCCSFRCSSCCRSTCAWSAVTASGPLAAVLGFLGDHGALDALAQRPARPVRRPARPGDPVPSGSLLRTAADPAARSPPAWSRRSSRSAPASSRRCCARERASAAARHGCTSRSTSSSRR